MYTTEMLRGIGKFAGISAEKTYHDMLHPKPVDERSPQEIVAEITAKAGLKVVD